MGLKAKATVFAGNKVEQDNIEPGSYPARLVAVVDLGVQAIGTKEYPKPPTHCIRVTYELTDVFMKDEDGNELEDKPRWVSEDLPFYPLEVDKAKCTKRYTSIDPDKEKDGDWSEILGNGVMVGIINKAAKNGKIYDNVGNTSVMRKKDLDKLEPLKNEPYFFSLDDPDMEVWAKKIPKWLQERITSGVGFEETPLAALLNGKPKAEKPKEEPKKQEAPVKDEVADDDSADAPW